MSDINFLSENRFNPTHFCCVCGAGLTDGKCLSCKHEQCEGCRKVEAMSDIDEIFDNQLSLAQAERLAILAEECGEVIQMVGKILRHGYRSYNPCVELERQKPNTALLEKELGDLMWIIRKMDAAADIDFFIPENSASLEARIRRKNITAVPYLHHQ